MNLEDNPKALNDILSSLRAGISLPNYFMGVRIANLSISGREEDEQMWRTIFFKGVFINQDYNFLLSEYCYLNPLT